MTVQKRLFDIVCAALLSVVLAPVIILIALILLIRQGRPVFYVSERMKTPTQGFGLVKFRTMTVVDRDQGVSGAHKASRITPVGRVLRGKRLDELPQLWNILIGDLSFVGPRPPLREYVEKHPKTYEKVLSSRPGVTGLATVRFHKHEAFLLARTRTAEETEHVYSNLCVPRKATLDLIYQRHSTLCFDVQLIGETVKHVLKR